MRRIKDYWLLFSYGFYLSRGYRFKPWKSPAIRFRFHTAFGTDQDNLTAKQMFSIMWRERKQLIAFARWVDEMKMLAKQQ